MLERNLNVSLVITCYGALGELTNFYKLWCPHIPRNHNNKNLNRLNMCNANCSPFYDLIIYFNWFYEIKIAFIFPNEVRRCESPKLCEYMAWAEPRVLPSILAHITPFYLKSEIHGSSSAFRLQSINRYITS